MNKKRVFLGTSGYSYKHWRGVFYPEALGVGQWLGYYTNFFNTVELNVTFYRLPTESVFSEWYKKAPAGFIFAVKGSRFITHIKRLKDCQEPLKSFFLRVRRLKEKLGPVLWQLPPSFRKDIERLSSFLKFLRKYKGIRYAFEFRHDSWYSEDVFGILKSENISLCSADWPAFSGQVIPTADFVYLRRHGQAARLYAGCYSKKQLKKDAQTITEYERHGCDVYIYFNNDAQGHAVRNALELNAMLNEENTQAPF